MIKKVIHRAMACIAILALLVSCQDESWQGESATREGYVTLRLTTDIPAMQEVVTRSVDNDGGGVQNMTLFCFDSYGIFITTVTAETTVTGEMQDLTGTIEADVPDNTRIIHFLANQNMTDFKEDHFRNHSESEVMALLEGSSGKMIYWARFACSSDDESDIKAQIASKNQNKIEMLRNHALISVVDPETNTYLVVTGMVVYNTNAFGTVAPYHPTKKFDFDWPTDEFITLPVDDAKMSDISDVTTNTGQYVFECENSADDPVSVIIRGHLPGKTDADDLYYRVMLVDNDSGDQLLIRRNHHYKINIEGALSFGQKEFADALKAAATNNVWISISDNVNEVEDANYILTVTQTSYVLSEEYTNKTYNKITYTLKSKNKDTSISMADKPEVTWIDNNVAAQNLGNDFTVTDGVGQGTITVSLLALGENEKLEGTLLVKKGRLQRKIKVITVKEQSFVPSWVGTQVYGTIDLTKPTEGRSHVTAMFTIPETCPAELFPLRVLISVNDLDVRSEAGVDLPVVREGDDGYGDPNGIGYKYLYIVESPGVQRVYFENILNQTTDYTGKLIIEAEHFAKMEREFTFSDTRKSITVTGLKAYSANPDNEETPNPDGFASDEYVLYRLVPQKIHANVQFDLQLREKTGDEIANDQQGDPFNAGEKDEFLLYSQNLDYYVDDEVDKAGVTSFDCTFYPDESDTWWRAYNPEGGRMLMFKPREAVRERPTGSEGKYSIYMQTNRAVSAEVVRIASNLPQYYPILEGDASTENFDKDRTAYYGGGSYRSVTFELANYNPFRFGARVKCDNGDWEGAAEEPDRTTTTEDIPEGVTPLTWTYEPDKKVDIAIDITSFKGSDGNSVDPFGESFEIYIDAPMLKIDEGRLDDCKLNNTKLREEPVGSGHFIYTVAADRDTERNFGTGDVVVNKDNAEVENEDGTTTVNQSGERKTLPFVTNSIVSAGDIVISSQEEKVVFYSKTFNVANESISGLLQYKNADGTLVNVSQNAFVSFELVRNNSRIGQLTVVKDGQYELRLRKEYSFSWYSDAVDIYYGTGANIYHKSFDSLSDLFKAPDIELEQKNPEPDDEEEQP